MTTIIQTTITSASDPPKLPATTPVWSLVSKKNSTIERQKKELGKKQYQRNLNSREIMI